jgi:hypothetical protein
MACPFMMFVEPGNMQRPILLVIVGMRLVASGRYMILQSLLDSEHVEAARPALSGSGSPMAGEAVGAPDLHTNADLIEEIVWAAQSRAIS